jgi:hypothetical protein
VLVNSVVLESSILIIGEAAAIFSCLPRLWFGSDGRLRNAFVAGLGALAGASFFANLIALPIYDDEVFYLAQAFSVRHGAASAYLPFRVWSYILYWPFIFRRLPRW